MIEEFSQWRSSSSSQHKSDSSIGRLLDISVVQTLEPKSNRDILIFILKSLKVSCNKYQQKLLAGSGYNLVQTIGMLVPCSWVIDLPRKQFQAAESKRQAYYCFSGLSFAQNIFPKVVLTRIRLNSHVVDSSINWGKPVEHLYEDMSCLTNSLGRRVRTGRRQRSQGQD